MSIQQIIAKKRDGYELNQEEIGYFIKEYTNGNITDYQAAALIMAIYINKMNEQEMINLTLEMARSGDVLDLSSISENVVDKHSTGGVGDKITLVLLPILASLGIPIAKMSGRGLGFTGGTIDKLESIPGYNTSLNTEEFINNVKKIGISIIGQTQDLAPADKKIYALRDSIACVGNMQLIASSIMSKKIAAGANKIILDVTVGKGAFMKNKDDATKLAKYMKNIGELANRETICVLTNMEEPVGYNIGNTLEIIETIECLKGNMPEDIEEIVTTLGAYMMKLAKHGDNIDENKLKIMENVRNGKAYRMFLKLVENQGGDISYIESIDKFEKAKCIIPFNSTEDGYVCKIDAEEIGKISVELGAGRKKKEDKIDNEVGIVLNKKIGDRIEKGETLAYIHAKNEQDTISALEQMKNAYEISKTKPEKKKNIIDIIM